MEDIIQFLEENQKSEVSGGGEIIKLYCAFDGGNIYKDSDLTIKVNKEELKEIFVRGCVVFDNNEWWGKHPINLIDEGDYVCIGCAEVNSSGNVIGSKYYSSEYIEEEELG